MLIVIIASSLVPCFGPGSTEDYHQPLSLHHIFEICCIIFLPTPWLLLCQHKNSKSKENHPFGLNASSPSCLTALHPGPHSRSLASKMLLMCILLLPPEMLFPRCPCSLHHHQIFAQRYLKLYSLLPPYLKLYSILPAYLLCLTAGFSSIACITIQCSIDCFY